MAEMTIEQAREQFNVFTVVAPKLDDNMRPDFELSDKLQCPLSAEKKGHCSECEKFQGFHSEGGVIMAYGAYEGFCDTKEV